MEGREGKGGGFGLDAVNPRAETQQAINAEPLRCLAVKTKCMQQ